MPNFESPKPAVPSFENDDFEYGQKTGEPVRGEEKKEPVESEPPSEEKVPEEKEAPKASEESISEEDFEKEAQEFEKVTEAVESQSEDLEKEAQKKTGNRFKGAGGFLGKAAVAIAAVLGRGGEAKTAEPAPNPARPAATYTMPPNPYNLRTPQVSIDRFGNQAMAENIVTSFGLKNLLFAKKVEDLGNGKFFVYKTNKKFELTIDGNCLKELSDIRRKYALSFNNRLRGLARSEVIVAMNTDLRDVIKRRLVEVAEDKAAVVAPKEKATAKKAETASAKKTAKESSPKAAPKSETKSEKDDYYKDAGAYDSPKR